MNDFKPRSKLLLEEISEKTTPDDSTRVVEKGTDSVTTIVNVAKGGHYCKDIEYFE